MSPAKTLFIGVGTNGTTFFAPLFPPKLQLEIIVPFERSTDREIGVYVSHRAAQSEAVQSMPRMKKQSAGILMYRGGVETLEVLLAHPGGPFWSKKDLGVWTIPKGEIEPGEDPLAAAQREFKEELGFPALGPFVPLGQTTQKSGKIVHAWAWCGDCNVAEIRSNMIFIEWPPKSGKRMEIPEIDRAEFFTIPAATQKINPAQVEFLQRLLEILGGR